MPLGISSIRFSLWLSLNLWINILTHKEQFFRSIISLSCSLTFLRDTLGLRSYWDFKGNNSSPKFPTTTFMLTWPEDPISNILGSFPFSQIWYSRDSSHVSDRDTRTKPLWMIDNWFKMCLTRFVLSANYQRFKQFMCLTTLTDFFGCFI